MSSEIPPIPLAAALATVALAIGKFGPKLLKVLRSREADVAAELAIARVPAEVVKLDERVDVLEADRDRAKGVRIRITAQSIAFEKRIAAIEAQNAAWHLANGVRSMKIQDVESQVASLRADLAALRKSHDECSGRGVATQILTARQDEQIDALTTRLDDVVRRLGAISSARWSAHGSGAAE